MKFFHLSDLHLGIRLNGYSMIEDQKDVLEKILNAVREERPDAVIIAGDVYDKSVPSEDAVRLYDDFIYDLSKENVQVMIISGNHDSAERLSTMNRLVSKAGIHISNVYDGSISEVVLNDDYGPVRFVMLPFVKPGHVKPYCQEKDIQSTNDAVKAVIDGMEIDEDTRNVLISHQFVTGATRSDSEDVFVGGTDNVDSSVFDKFDYVALGHIHGPQNIGNDKRVRYCGTPLKYSFSEVKHKKSITVVELGKKGDFDVRTIDLDPLHEMCEVRDSYANLVSDKARISNLKSCLLRVILTDEDDIPSAKNRLESCGFEHILLLEYDNTRTRAKGQLTSSDAVVLKGPLENIEDFFRVQNGRDMNEEEIAVMMETIKKIWG